METKATKETRAIMERLARRGIDMPMADVGILRRAALTLHRWAEQECGDGNDYGSWCITRDETTGKPYREYHPNNGNTATRTLIADREAGALKRVKAICARHGLQFYHQTDPRGCALYVAKEPMAGDSYSSVGVAIA